MSDGILSFRENLFAGKRAFISGGTSGINLGIAKGLARCGAQVAVLGRDGEKAARAAAEISALGPMALPLTGDVREFEAMEESIQETVNAFGGLDFVIAGAAGNFIAPAEKLSTKGFRTVVDIDLLGSFNVFKAAYPHLIRPGASLIAISSGQAYQPVWGQAHASAAKAGVESLIRTLAIEWGHEGIRVNSICPGAIEATEGVERLISPERQERIRNRLPLTRFGHAEEIAHSAIFLLSEAAAYVTGTTLFCDGGLFLVGFGEGERE